jgi:hypothetical protein
MGRADPFRRELELFWFAFHRSVIAPFMRATQFFWKMGCPDEPGNDEFG